LARSLVGNAAVAVPERRRQLKQITADVRYDYDQQISRIRSDIAAIGMSIFHVTWRAVLRFAARTPSTGAAAVAKLRVQLAEAHAAKFAALAELKDLRALA
jgi:hypothetical protein